MQEQLGLRFVGLPDQVGLCLDGVRALIAAHRLGLCPTLLHEDPVPAHGAGRADLEAPRRLPARSPRLDRGYDTLAQINGQGRRHRLSSSESRPSNHITATAETLHDSIRSVTALVSVCGRPAMDRCVTIMGR